MPKAKTNDIQLLRLGRHFWEEKILYVVGRNHEENEKLKKLAQKNDVLIEPKTFPGPTILIRSYTPIPITPITPIPLIPLLKKYSPHAPKKISSKDFKQTFRIC